MTTAGPNGPSPGSSASRPGCGATPTSSTSSAGCARTTSIPPARPGFYGLDLYSLYRSIEAVVAYLDRIDPAAAERARERYRCLERFEESQAYGYAAAQGLTPGCREGVLRELVDLRAAGDAYLRRDGIAAEDEQFYAEENARLVVDAEQYYRSMFTGPISSWNLRDSHMAGTLERLVARLGSRGGSRTVVWAHNSHVGDARRTSMGLRGEHNIGQLARERWGLGAVLIGFTTCSGTVSAASDWGATVERKRVSPRRSPDSIEELLGRVDHGAFWLRLRDDGRAAAELYAPRPQRAIGVIYRPESELTSHYFEAHASEQFDYLIHFDETRAVEPLERTAEWQRGEPPETYPTSL